MNNMGQSWAQSLATPGSLSSAVLTMGLGQLQHQDWGQILRYSGQSRRVSFKNGHERGDDVSMMGVVTCPGSRVPRVGSGLSRVDVNVPMCRNYDTLLQNYAHISLCSGTHKLTSQPFSPLGLTHFLATSIFFASN